jgi:hypothetical protein
MQTLPLPTHALLGTRPSPKRNAPKRAPPTALRGTLLTPTAFTLILSSIILRTVGIVFRRHDVLRWAVFLLGGKVCIWKQAREVAIASGLKSTCPLILSAEKFTQGDIPLELIQTSLRSRLSRKPHGRHIKDERK